MSDETQPTTSLKQLLANAPDEDAAGFDWADDAPMEPEAEQLTLLQFHHGRQRYAIAGEDVREVISRGASTELPGAPGYIRGIMIHRRQVIGLLDLDRWFGVNASEAVGTERVIVVEHQGMVAGILADASTRIVSWSSDVLQRALPGSLSSRVRHYAHAIRRDDEGTVLMLDIARLLEDAAIKG